MKLTNYAISRDYISLIANETYIDLHNNFKLQSIEYRILERTAVLSWVKSDGEWVPQNSPASVTLIFSGVYFFKCKERDSEYPFSEDTCVDLIGFIGDDLTEEMNGVNCAEPDEIQNHLNISFCSFFAIKIGANSSSCVLA